MSEMHYDSSEFPHEPDSTDVYAQSVCCNQCGQRLERIENMLLELKRIIANVGPALAQSPLGAMFAGILGGE